MNKLKLIIFSAFIIAFVLIPQSLNTINAQERPSSDDVDITIDDKVTAGIEEIRIPIFTSVIGFNTSTASVFSWIAFVGSLGTVGLIIFWIYLLVRAGINGMQSQGSDEALAEAFKKVKAVLVGAGTSLAFPIILSIVGAFFGIGSIFNWPRAFQLCDINTEKYDWYFQALFDKDANPQSSPEVADTLCIKSS